MSHRKLFFSLLLIACFLICFLNVQPSYSQSDSLGFIIIRPDGRVEPTQAPIQNIGGVYTLTGNIYDPIVLEQNNIVLNGAGHYLLGNGTGTPPVQVSSGTGPTINLVGRDNGIGINITCSNATIMNIHIINWVAGIVGAYDNNTIAANFITNCQTGIKIFGVNYTIIGNYIGTNDKGVQLAAIQTLITQNNVTGNQIGFEINYSNHTVIENNISNIDHDIVGRWTNNVVIYHNNFLNGDKERHLQLDPTHQGHLIVSSNGTWDNSYPSGGNYWFDYVGVDANNDGIGDEHYKIRSVYNYPNIPDMPVSSVVGEDNYPLMHPFVIKAFTPILLTSPSPSSTSLLNPTLSSSPEDTSSPNPSVSPSSTIPELPSWTILLIAIVMALLTAIIVRRNKPKQ